MLSSNQKQDMLHVVSFAIYQNFLSIQHKEQETGSGNHNVKQAALIPSYKCSKI
jgi:hypothetical protein